MAEKPIANLCKFDEAVTKVAKISFYEDANYRDGINSITAQLASLLEADWAALWELSGSQAIALDLYDASSNKHSPGTIFAQKSFPIFLDELDSRRCIEVSNTDADPRTAELKDKGAAIAHSGALLAVPIRKNGVLSGFINCMRADNQKTWTEREKAFACAMADQAARACQENTHFHELQLLLTEKEQFRALVEKTEDIMLLLDEKGHYRYINPVFEKILGLSPTQMIGQRAAMSLDPEERDKIDAGLQQARSQPKEPILISGIHAQDKEGKDIELEATICNMLGVDSMESYVVKARHVDGKKQIEHRLQQIQKMDLLGQLTTGIAHDFNNLLTIINGNLEYLEESVQGNKKLLGAFRDLQVAGWRGAELTELLMSFGGSDPRSTQTFEIDQRINALQPRLNKSLTNKITLDQKLGANTASCTVNDNDFDTVVLNMCHNAQEAMPEGGTVRISTSVRSVARKRILSIGELQKGTYLRLSVCDDGPGIPESSLDKIFEPFFTTKKDSGHTGLGLATVYGFIKRSGGALNVRSSPAKGTCFNLYIPLSEPTNETQPAKPRRRTKLPDLSGKTTLVVDDELEIVSLVRRVLTKAGAKVFESSSASEAMQILKAVGPVDLLISDIVMPTDVSGLDLAKFAAKNEYAKNIVLMTGYSGDILSNSVEKYAYEGLVLKKPFQLNTLVNTINTMLA